MKVTVVVGSEGHSLYFDGYRVAGPKPWGGGTVIDEWTVAESTDTRALDGQVRWFLDNNPNMTDADALDGIRTLLALPPETGR